jgi:hypothetical protein
MNGKRIAALILMIVSVVLMLVLIVAVAGLWTGRALATNAITVLAHGADQGFTITIEHLNRVDGQLSQAAARTQALQQHAAQVGATAEANQVALTFIQQTVSDELGPLIERIQEGVSAVGDLVRSVNQSVQALNALPFVHVEVPGAEQFKKLSAHSDELQAATQDLRSQAKETSAAALQKTIETTTRTVQRLDSALGEAHSVVVDLTTELKATQGLVPLAADRVLSSLDVAVWVLTVIMLLLGLGQVSLFLHGYALYTRRDPVKSSETALSPL